MPKVMEPFCTLTVDRGDRGQFLDFCRHQIDRFVRQPKHKIFVTEPPTSDKVDLTKRIKMGIQAAKGLGIDIIYIVESDDWYDKHYIGRHWIGDNDFIGSSKTVYYHIFNKSYTVHSHPNHSSLFCTAFRISALENFIWPPDDTVFLDIDLWRHAIKGGNYILRDEPIGVGIKHGIGKCAGNGHRAHYQDVDKDGSILRGLVDREAYAFYQSL